MTTIAQKYRATSGETVVAACKRMHAAGVPIKHAAARIGFYGSPDLRKYFERRALPCPWGPGGSRPRVPGAVLEQYVALRLTGRYSARDCVPNGYTLDQMNASITKYRPDLREKLAGVRQSVAKRYEARTGETVVAACVRMKAEGRSITYAWKAIGYARSDDLRKYLKRLRVECPWPVNERVNKRRARQEIGWSTTVVRR